MIGMPSHQHQQQGTPPLSTSPTSIGSRARSSVTTVSVPSPKSLKRVSLPPTLAAAAAANAKPSDPPVTVTTTTKKVLVPWRNPGKWQIPDVIEEAWKQRQQQQQQQQQQRRQQDDDLKKKEKEEEKKHQLHKRPWRTVGRVPDIWPIPPPIVCWKPKEQGLHPEFEGKLKKILPPSKAMEGNPYKQFTDTSKIGSGANGAVVRATKKHGPQVAIKRCLIEDHDTNHHAYVLREIRIMGCLSHPNLIQLLEAGMWKDDLWMAMELMQCSVFNLLFNTTKGLSEPYAIFIARQVLEGLVYLHSKNYMHRDVKCENILLGRDGQVKLADFGLATPLNKTNSERLGTAKWMAPEVIAVEPYKENVDIWSLAITMIEMMDRVPPLYDVEDTRQIFYQILYGKPPSFTFSKPSSTVLSLVRGMLNPDGAVRPGATDMRNRIDQLVQEGQLLCAKQPELAELVQQVFPHPP